ncbi:RING finger protein nhl-1 isoform X1 [Oopsacas minuta]|uniref:RING finger protein nhl-1 isoform X1 n=1 Tax=Oopsacas minuta TaxID=111878 RepID=A0AAV7KCK0_9METZ|nr:RING finger protein nhl-1 isoform X1 [Oopsacas minuta]
MATEFGAGMHEETARELERLRREVLMAKEELRARFEFYFRVLQEKHLEMEVQLDEVVRMAEAKVVDRHNKLDQLLITQAEVTQNLVHNELNVLLENMLRGLDNEIQVLEAIGDRVPSVWLEWHEEWLEGGMGGLCRVVEGVSYVNRHKPVWSGVNGGIGSDEIFNPSDLSIDRDNGDIYVSDWSVHRIQVFCKDGSYKRTIKAQGMSHPTDIAVTPHQLFVICFLPDNILKLDKVSGEIMCQIEPSDSISCITTDVDTLYEGICKVNHISHYSLEDLSKIKETALNSPHITQDTRLFGLRTTPSLFVVLFGKCDYLIQLFSRDGNFFQVIASQELLTDPRYICLDRHQNIIVSNYGANNIKVISIEGHIVTIIGHEGEGPGEFCSPYGIDINEEGRIVVVDRKDSHRLQFF